MPGIAPNQDYLAAASDKAKLSPERARACETADVIASANGSAVTKSRLVSMAIRKQQMIRGKQKRT